MLTCLSDKGQKIKIQQSNMLIKTIKLKNFKNFEDTSFTFKSKNIPKGKNGSGHRFIYMGEYVETKSGVIREKHKIRLLK